MKKKIKFISFLVLFLSLLSTPLVKAEGWCGWSNLLMTCAPYRTSDGYCAVSGPSCDPVVVEGEREQ